MSIIQTKSFQDPIGKKDGFRICVMRRFKPEYQFDCWLPVLAPTEKLLTGYVKNKTMGWKDFSAKYKKSVLDKNKVALEALLRIAEVTTITLLCQEPKETHCHRVLIKRACQEMIRQKHQMNYSHRAHT